ncbi:MAG: hypothetical protein KC635_14190, partial [Myxococcales bacterium]|nr:hypothetical protein [Myxococcales bacterium]
SLALALADGSASIPPLGDLAFTGSMSLASGALQSFDLAVTSAVALDGVALSGGVSLRYDRAARTLAFAVDDASVTVVGLGALGVSGEAQLTDGQLGALRLAVTGGVSLAGVAVTGDTALVYVAAEGSLSLSVAGTVTVGGFLAPLSVAGETRLEDRRLTALSLAVSGGASFQGVALAGALRLDYAATYDAGGAVLSRSLALAVSDASLALPDATASLGGRLVIADGAVACADLGPATVSLAGVDFAATARYVAAGETCGHLATPAPAASFTGAFVAELDVIGHPVVVAGEAAVANGAVDRVALSAAVDLSGVVGLTSASVHGEYAGGELCLGGDVAGTLPLAPGAELRGISARFCADGLTVSAVELDVHVLAPNLVGEPLDLLARVAYEGASGDVAGGLCLATVDLGGAPCCAGVDACPTATWHPFSGGVIPGLPGEWAGLTVEALAGSVSLGASGLSVSALGIFDADAVPPLVPGLALRQLAVALDARVGADTEASAGIHGVFTLPLGEEPVDVTVDGGFQLGGGQGIELTLTGSLGDAEAGQSADIQPLRAVIGDGAFEITFLRAMVSASTSAGVSFELQGGANFRLPPPVNLGPFGVELGGYGNLGKRPGFWLKGAFCGLELPAGLLPAGFDAIPLGGPSPCPTPLVAVALASRAFPEVEIAPNTPIRRGLTLATTIPAPRAVLAPLGLAPAEPASAPALPGAPALPAAPSLPSVPSVTAEIGVDTSGVRLKGALNLPWQIVRPDWNLPTIKLLQLNQVSFEVLLSSAPSLTFTGDVLFEPNHCIPDYQSFVEAGLASDQSPLEAFDPAKITCLDLPAPFRAMPQQTPLRGTASFRYKPPKEFGGDIALTGIWYEPFWIPNLAISNPGFTVSIRLVTLPYGIQAPVPTSFGVAGDVYWKRPYYDDAAAKPAFPVACASDADCVGYGNCAGGACPVACVDGPDGDTLPDTCEYTWPYTCAAPDPAGDAGTACVDTLYQPAEVPPSLAHTGLTFFYDVYPTPSGLLGLPLPTLIVRREVNNLNTLDLVPALNELKDGSRNLLRWAEDRLPGLSPALSPFPPCVDLDGDGQLDRSLSCLFPATPLPNVLADLPVALALDHARFYFSTHDRELFGVSYAAGVRADLDVKLTEVGAPTCSAVASCHDGLTCDHGTCKRALLLTGALGTDGLFLEGKASPISFLDAVTIKGDPFTKVADTSGGGYVEVPAAPALEAA